MKIATIIKVTAVTATVGLSSPALGQDLDGLSYLDGTSWYATSIDQDVSGGHSATPYRIYQLRAGACAFRFQLDRARSGTGEQILSPEVDGGFVAQITSPGCQTPSRWRDDPAGRAMFAANPAHPGWGDLAIGIGLSVPNDGDDGRTAMFGLSADRREIRFVADDLEFDPAYSQHRIRIRFNRLEAPTRARVFVEGRAAGAWEALATIDMARYRDGRIWGAPLMVMQSPFPTGRPGQVDRRPNGGR